MRGETLGAIFALLLRPNEMHTLAVRVHVRRKYLCRPNGLRTHAHITHDTDGYSNVVFARMQHRPECARVQGRHTHTDTETHRLQNGQTFYGRACVCLRVYVRTHACGGDPYFHIRLDRDPRAARPQERASQERTTHVMRASSI